jgi:Family of unknown function (DUF6527)
MSDDVMVQSGDRWLFRCPGCNCAHQIDSRWTFNGDARKPTIGGSILVHAVTLSRRDGETVETFDRPQCHSFVTDGRIQFLADSTHELAGQTVDMPPWEQVR